MKAKRRINPRLQALRSIFTSPLYIFITVAAIVAYYELFYYLILASNKGVFLVTAPLYLIYALVLSSAALFSVSVYTVEKALRTRYAGVEGGILSVITSSFGGLVVGCSCYAPVVSSVLYAIGFGTLQVGAAISVLSAYQAWFVLLFIAANIAFIFYQLGRIIRIGGASAKR